MARLVLIDRDGTINVERNYLSDPEQIELIPQAAEGIKILREAGFRIVIITNQSAVGRGYFDLKKLDEIHERLQKLLSESGAKIDAIYFCPHTPQDNCRCRKPLTEMANRAGQDFNANLTESFVIGDNLCDIELGKNIGATTILVRTGYGKKIESSKEIMPDHIVNNLFEGAILVKKTLQQRSNTNL